MWRINVKKIRNKKASERRDETYKMELNAL